MAATNPQRQSPADVTFTLSYSTLISLIQGEVSPVSAYLNGQVKIAGSIEDAMSLNHLAARAKELNLKLLWEERSELLFIQLHWAIYFVSLFLTTSFKITLI